jgi:SAM-dependent methyltransferase
MSAMITGSQPDTLAPTGAGSSPAEDLSWAPDDNQLAALHESFDSYWQAPDDVESGYAKFRTYYRANVLPHLDDDKSSPVLCVSCGPGYLVDLLREEGYGQITGIDSDPDKIAYANKRGLPCETARCFAFLKAAAPGQYGQILLEQELNHLTHPESIAFLKLCHRALRPGGTIYAYGLNGNNPIVGAENLCHNIDHFSTYGEHSLTQVMELGGFRDVRVLPLKLYVFWKNPLNYVGLAVTTVYEAYYRFLFRLYGKSASIFTKKIAAVAKK